MITRYLFRNPRIVWLLIATIVIAGCACFLVMPRLEDPVLRPRVAVISTVFPGANPAELESTVTAPIEQWLNEFSEIKQVRSNTRTSSSNVVIELQDSVTETADVWAAIESRILSKASNLPEGCQDPELTVFPLKAFAAILAIQSTEEKPDRFQQRRLVQELKSRVLNLSATESVQIFGDPGEELVIQLSPEMLAATGLSPGNIAQQIQQGQAVPAGDSEQNGLQLIVDVANDRQLEQQVGDTFIRYRPDQPPVRLSEIATIEKRHASAQSTAAIIADQPAIVLGVMVDNQSRVDLWARELEDVLYQFRLDFPGNYQVESLFSQSRQIDQRMGSLLTNLSLSTLAVVLLVFLLMGWRCMLVVAISLPLSALLVICGLRFLDIPIHQMSVTGLIVALGLLIDNAIVMVEEVRSRIFQGVDRLSALVDAVKHLSMPLFGSTLTTILAFLPIATLPGPSGEFVGSIAISVILAIAASFLLAVTLIPSLVAMFGVSDGRMGFFEYGLRFKRIETWYRQTLRVTFRYPLLGVVLGALLPALGFLASGQLNRQFFPATDRSQIQIELELPAANSLAAVEETVQRVHEIVAQDSRVARQNWFLGESAPTFYYNVIPRRRGTPSYAQAFVDVDSKASINELVANLQSKIDKQVLDARVIVRKLEQGPPFDAPVEVRLLGPDLATLERLGTQLRKIMAETDFVTHTRSDLEDTVPKLTLQLDESVAKDVELTRNDISKFLFTVVEGAPAGTRFEGGQEIPLRVTVDFQDRSQVETLAALSIHSEKSRSAVPGPGGANPQQPGSRPSGPVAPLLGSLGKFRLDSDVAAIIRWNGQRANEVKAYLQAGVLPSVVLDQLQQRLAAADFQVPAGYQLQIGGESEKRNEAISNLIANAVILFALMLLALVAVLGSFRSALIIASVGGLAVGLGPLALYLFGFPFGFMAIVGTMGLVGVAINDSIVVLAAIRANDRLKFPANAGDDLDPVLPETEETEPAETPRDLDEVVFGCTRHILATTLTTMIGFLPLVIGGGKFWPPLAIVISAGVGGATMLALYFVPSMNLLLRSFSAKTRRLNT